MIAIENVNSAARGVDYGIRVCRYRLYCVCGKKIEYGVFPFPLMSVYSPERIGVIGCSIVTGAVRCRIRTRSVATLAENVAIRRGFGIVSWRSLPAIRGVSMKHVSGIGGCAAILLLLSTLMGCASVTLQWPLPAKIDAAEQALFEGEWISEGQIIYVRFTDDGAGRFAGVDWKEGRFQMDEGEIIVSKGRERSFLSVRVKENGVWDERYYFAQYRFTEPGEMVLWLPDTKAFGEAVEKGMLEGSVEKGKHTQSVTISSEPEKVLAILNDPANGALFGEKEPMILKRLMLPSATGEKEGASSEVSPVPAAGEEEESGQAPMAGGDREGIKH